MPNEIVEQGSEISFLKNLIQNFLTARLQEKLKTAKDEPTREKLRNKFQIENWLTDAARRVDSIKLATHAVKFINSDAEGSSFYIRNIKENLPFVATSILPEIKPDIVGNAADLDVGDFLLLNCNNQTLLTRALRNDAVLRAALPGSEQQKNEWLAAFAGIIQIKGQPASHTLAKQIYFPADDKQYHLLLPLFPTSLVQTVFERISEAKTARKNNQPHPHGYSHYPNLILQRFGGSNPQNVSLLNKKKARGGKTYLLPSLPPIWQQQLQKPPLNYTSIFKKFSFIARYIVSDLKKYLTEVLEQNNKKIRVKRENMVQQIMDILLNYVVQIQALTPGWSDNTACKLPKEQQFWLDPGRAAEDEEWRQQREQSDWRETICESFASWLNDSLKTRKLIFGDAEHGIWRSLLEKELKLLREIL